jgi:hypothetical protein
MKKNNILIYGKKGEEADSKTTFVTIVLTSLIILVAIFLIYLVGKQILV